MWIGGISVYVSVIPLSKFVIILPDHLYIRNISRGDRIRGIPNVKLQAEQTRSYFQVLQTESWQMPIISPKLVKKSKGKVYNRSKHTLILAQSNPMEISIPEGDKETASQFRAWFQRYQEEKGLLWGDKGIFLGGIVDLKDAIVQLYWYEGR